jgi:hypothetical protein
VRKQDPTDEEARLRRAERREAVARANLQSAGPADRVLKLLDHFTRAGRLVSDTARAGHRERFGWALDTIVELELMLLPEHRAGVAGAVVALLHQYYPDVDRPDDFMPVDKAEIEKVFIGPRAKLVDACVRMTPPPRDAEISRPNQVEWLWMAWATNKAAPLLSRIASLAHRRDEVGEMAILLLSTNAGIPEVQHVLQRLRQDQGGITNMASGQQAIRNDVSSLRLLLTADPLWRRQILFVAWIPGDDQGFVVVTRDGITPPNCPTLWRQRPVKVRAPLPAELAKHEAMRSMAEDP